jgi:hypothetical protein
VISRGGRRACFICPAMRGAAWENWVNRSRSGRSLDNPNMDDDKFRAYAALAI